jgi:hypothetical protein
MSTDLEAVTFKVVLEQAHTNWKASVEDDTNNNRITGGWFGNKQSSLLTLYLAMTNWYHSFRLVVEEEGQVVQEFVYREVRK